MEVKDSGSRRTNKTGAQKEGRDIEKGRWDLIPPLPIWAVAKIYAAGAEKYAPYNWMKGLYVSDILDSLKRHIGKFELGMEDEPHVDQVIWNAIALSWTIKAARDGLIPEECIDIPCYMPKNANPDEWRKENRLIDGWLQEKDEKDSTD